MWQLRAKGTCFVLIDTKVNAKVLLFYYRPNCVVKNGGGPLSMVTLY